MTQQASTDQTSTDQTNTDQTTIGLAAAQTHPVPVLPEMAVRLGGALLALAVAAAHVADQGGITAFTSPDWLGWAYRLIEAGGVLTAIALVWPRSARIGWASGLLLGAAPFLGYVASRTTGVPGDTGDVGNWTDWVGTLSLIVEAGLFTLSAGWLWTLLHLPRQAERAMRPLQL